MVKIESRSSSLISPKVAIFPTPAFAKTTSSLPFSRLICAKRRSRLPRLAPSPCTPVTFSPDLLHRRRQLRITAPRYEDVRAFVHKPLRRREADAARATGDEGSLSVQLAHVGLPTPPLLHASVRASALASMPFSWAAEPAARRYS